VQSRDLDGDPRFAGGRARPAPVRALVLPLRAPDGEVIGALAAEWDGRRPDPAVAEELARVLALALANTRLRQRQARFALELEERVHAATATLQSLDRARGNFLSTVSHELRTPLTALRGFSELLLARAVPGEQARRFLEHIHAESGRLARIVEDLLDLARIDAGQAPALAPERLDLVSLVDANLELFAVAHAAHRFERVGGGPALAWADRDAMDRVLKNLLSNAVKYSPRGGRVRVCLAAAAAAGTVALAVEDEGVGIPPEGCRRIFERYVRLGHPDTAGVRGLGLGLAMVRGLVEAQGGTIEVRSQPGRGSCFTVRLPAAP
jgi:signal transduction histidine kinase